MSQKCVSDVFLLKSPSAQRADVRLCVNDLFVTFYEPINQLAVDSLSVLGLAKQRDTLMH